MCIFLLSLVAILAISGRPSSISDEAPVITCYFLLSLDSLSTVEAMTEFLTLKKKWRSACVHEICISVFFLSTIIKLL